MAKTKDFFVDRKEQSRIKTNILLKYFNAWSKILVPRSRTGKIAYIDLFSGPGKYEDGSPSTPLLILEKCIAEPALAESLVSIFNDADKETSEQLEKNISELPGISNLEHTPGVLNLEVGDEIASLFAKKNLIPTLAFVDPWGYKGLTTGLINSLIKDFGSDCIFFFNYNRINMGINNDLVQEHMSNLFGNERLAEMKKRVKTLEKEEKELFIVNELAESLSDERKNLVLPFRFVDENKNKTSHYLIFVSKHELGYTIMKDIMAGESTMQDDGVANFSYIPVKHITKHTNVQLDLLASYERKLDSLGSDLKEIFSGKTLSVNSIVERHHIGTPFIKKIIKKLLDD
ncbi:hypothetical protein JCM9140_3102 [Halalkalibacter wakoensis JCM 9140]|uniref:GMT-like wHTH domain-containing protein n=1 Tax=Halalkalibacter wakoensis JCM 9140 TaxID=1236970 RepID=W4Q4S8_9BACI|nr:three-Cys-motif partner protein TcmP [Halalkalibacter wakoensis]GAE26992.1 hypothetical protein JCM9140_3102 [Halalkalibacter wakoensis JCM 9140]